MKIHILSDIHNECRNAPFVPGRTNADVVILAGDIGPCEHSFPWAAEHFKGQRIVMVAGNHDAWGAEWHQRVKKMRALGKRYDINFLENEAICIDGVRFIGASLFTDMMLYGPDGYWASVLTARNKMPDFQRVRIASKNRWLKALGFSRPMFPEDAAELHQISRAFIENELKDSAGTPDAPMVVITHHAPSVQSIEKRFENDPLTPCFVSRLDAMISQHAAALWVHGHTHTAFDYQIERTRVICNPLGYEERRADQAPRPCNGFNPGLLVEL